MIDVKEKIAKILENINSDIKEYENTDFINEGLLDSLEMFELIDQLESEFNIMIDGSDIIPENFKNVNTIIEMIKKY